MMLHAECACPCGDSLANPTQSYHAQSSCHVARYRETACGSTLQPPDEAICRRYVSRQCEKQGKRMLGGGNQIRRRRVDYQNNRSGSLLELRLRRWTELVEAVVDEQGRAGLSRLVASPPISTEQVLFPQRYLDGEAPAEVARPEIPTGGVLVADGRIGAALLAFAVADAVGSDASLELISGWAGDRYVLFEQSGATCLRAAIEMDSAEQARALFAELEAAVPIRAEAEPVQVAESSITVSTC